MNPKMRDMENKPVYDVGGFPIRQYGNNKETGERFPPLPADDQVDSPLDRYRLSDTESNQESVDTEVEHDNEMRDITGNTKGVGPFPKYGYEDEGQERGPHFSKSRTDMNNDYGSVVRNNERRESNEVSPSRGNLLSKPLSVEDRYSRYMEGEREKVRGKGQKVGMPRGTGQKVRRPINKEPLPDAPPMRPYEPGERSGRGRLLSQLYPNSLSLQDKDDRVTAGQGTPPAKRITSLQEQVGRYYPAESGGVAGAINKAQEAQEKNPGNLDRNRWPKQTRGGIEGDQQVSYGPSEEGRTPDSAAYWQGPITGWIGLPNISPTHTAPGISYINDADDSSFGKDSDEQNSLEHELTHGSILGGENFRTPGITDKIRENKGPFSPDRKYEGDQAWHNPSAYYQPEDLRYAMSPTEIDVRLAEVKRRYAQHTGIIVETPEQAEQAIKWFNQTRGERNYKMGEHDSGNHELWNMLTPDQMDEILYRMPELVMDTNVLEGLT